MTISTREPVPLEFSVIFGDAAHNLRSALDILMNDVIALSGVTPKGVYFPFANSEGELDGQIKEKMRGASADIIDIVRALKPYRGGNIVLRALHDLDIRDKHISIMTTHTSARFMPAVRLVPSKKLGAYDMISDFGATETEPIDKKGWPDLDQEAVEIIGKMKGSTYRVPIAPNLPLEGTPVIEALHKMRDLTQGIVETFEAHSFGHKKPSP